MAARDLRALVGRLLLLLNAAIAVGASVWVLLVFLAPESMSTPPHGDSGVFRLDVRGSESFWLLAAFAAALLVGDFLWIVYGGSPRMPTTHVQSETPEGPVKVSREALESGLRAAGEALDEISRLRVAIETVGPTGRRVVVKAQFQAPEGVSLQLANQRLRAALRRRFDELVRLADGGRLDLEIEFVGFQGRLAKKVDEAEPREEEVDAPFTGPRYPIDGG